MDRGVQPGRAAITLRCGKSFKRDFLALFPWPRPMALRSCMCCNIPINLCINAAGCCRTPMFK